MLTDTSAIQEMSPELEEVVRCFRRDPGGVTAWDTATQICAEANETAIEKYWIIGDIADFITMESTYGKNTLKRFALDSGLNNSTVNRYRQVSRAFNFATRSKFRDVKLDYMHFYHARTLDPADAEAFLFECADEGWTAAQAKRELDKRFGKPPAPARILEATGYVHGFRPASEMREGDSDPDGGHLVLRFERGVNWWPVQDALNSGLRVKVTVMEARDASNGR